MSKFRVLMLALTLVTAKISAVEIVVGLHAPIHDWSKMLGRAHNHVPYGSIALGMRPKTHLLTTIEFAYPSLRFNSNLLGSNMEAKSRVTAPTLTWNVFIHQSRKDIRPYAGFGMGLSSFYIETEFCALQKIKARNQLAFAFQGELGVEVKLSPRVFLGIGGRYVIMTPIQIESRLGSYLGSDTLQSASVLMRLTWGF